MSGWLCRDTPVAAHDMMETVALSCAGRAQGGAAGPGGDHGGRAGHLARLQRGQLWLAGQRDRPARRRHRHHCPGRPRHGRRDRHQAVRACAFRGCQPLLIPSLCLALVVACWCGTGLSSVLHCRTPEEQQGCTVAGPSICRPCPELLSMHASVTDLLRLHDRAAGTSGTR